eukprot:m.175666 g.175666  ORF g.175666 m.175666 type:complete len:55 (-) comp24414_c1_seq5:1250-1414(-)
MTKDEGLNLVVVEGGAKSIGKYKKLMMRRIKWAGDGNTPTCPPSPLCPGNSGIV